jgi:hypothetical protein
MLTFILPIFVLIALVASLPIWPHSKKWSFYPLGGVSLVILIILFLFWTGRKILNPTIDHAPKTHASE